MVSMENYRKFVEVLNKSNDLRHKAVTTKDEFVMIAALDVHVMSPSKAKEVLNDMLDSKIIEKRGDYIRYDNLYDDKRKEFVVVSKSGKVLPSRPLPSEMPKRTVRYAGPGHTIIGYEHRTLHIRFPETKKEFDARAKARRRKASKNRIVSNEILIDRDIHGNMMFVSKRGSDVGLKARSRSEKGKTAIIKKNLGKDVYTIEDMRARLRDDHWEEVVGNRRWNYDPKETVRQFNKYLKTSKR